VALNSSTVPCASRVSELSIFSGVNALKPVSDVIKPTKRTPRSGSVTTPVNNTTQVRSHSCQMKKPSSVATSTFGLPH